MLRVDEKPQIQATTRAAPMLPRRPGRPERRTHGYRRAGTTDPFAALDVQSGRVIGRGKWRHRPNAACSRPLSVWSGRIHASIDQTDAEPEPFVWTKSADNILAGIRHFCQRTSNSDHSAGDAT